MKLKIAVAAGISLLWFRYIMAGLEDDTISNAQRWQDYPDGWDYEEEQKRLKRKYPEVYAFWEMRYAAQKKVDGLFCAAKGKLNKYFCKKHHRKCRT